MMDFDDEKETNLNDFSLDEMFNEKTSEERIDAVERVKVDENEEDDDDEKKFIQVLLNRYQEYDGITMVVPPRGVRQLLIYNKRLYNSFGHRCFVEKIIENDSVFFKVKTLDHIELEPKIKGILKTNFEDVTKRFDLFKQQYPNNVFFFKEDGTYFPPDIIKDELSKAAYCDVLVFILDMFLPLWKGNDLNVDEIFSYFTRFFDSNRKSLKQLVEKNFDNERYRRYFHEILNGRNYHEWRLFHCFDVVSVLKLTKLDFELFQKVIERHDIYLEMKNLKEKESREQQQQQQHHEISSFVKMAIDLYKSKTDQTISFVDFMELEFETVVNTWKMNFMFKHNNPSDEFIVNIHEDIFNDVIEFGEIENDCLNFFYINSSYFTILTSFDYQECTRLLNEK